MTVDGVPAARLAARWGVPQAGVFRALPSVMDAIHELAAQGAPAGTVVLAEEQAAGRGRDGRTWRSPKGGVWLGLLLRPPGVELAATAIRAGIAVGEAIDQLVGRPVTRLKWPNDVMLDGRKLAGILCEGRWQGGALQWLALGVGANVANVVPPELESRAIALRDVLPEARRLDLLDRLVPGLLRLATPGAQLSERELSAFAARDWLHGRQLARPLFGRAAGIRPDGALLVEMGAGTVAVRDGHVELA
ncbi:MAG TPA: biotin--[acetyl-CoA-carboxylase] ligase [Gemmatimonadales bacterium]